MAGIILLLDFLKKNPSLATQSLHSYSLFSATVAASAAAASVAAGKPFASRAIFGDCGFPTAYCDAGSSATWNDEDIPNVQSASENIISNSFKDRTKEYPLELKPLFSAFGFKSFAMTSLRSFLLFYLPLLEPRPPVEENDDLLHQPPEERPVDLVAPFQNSVKQIIRETAVVTTRRVLERFAVQHVSQRMAWKLLKDVPRSAKRKFDRGMPTLLFFYSVSRTTFRGHMLGVAASWIIQVIIEIYRCFFRKHNNDDEDININEKIRLFRRKLFGTTVKCSASEIEESTGFCALVADEIDVRLRPMDPSLNQPSPEVEEAEWDTDGFVIPSLTIGDSNLANTNVPGVTDSKPPATTTIEAEKIYLGPHGAPPSQAKQQEVKASGRKLSFKHKLKEADRRFSGTGRENKVETLQQLVGGKVSSATMPRSSPRDWLDPHCHESQYEKYP
ncbi:hypothetical protein MUK42_35382 [Musa troglodytarum]|uniref:Uncharacterized protein n=1 Tax=Musa troglodytarum TaxID=320322 RepID=A0A9E7KFX6_9LILI|nr:hypothetical protein MUK42_35382 [Musa troglodytarum]